MAVHSVSPHEVHRYGIVAVGANGRVDRFTEKPRRSDTSLASMGIYAFRREFLVDVLRSGNDQDFGKHMLPRIIRECAAYAYPFQGYWADVGTVQAYYEANLALLAETPALDLYDPEWVIHTTSADRPGVEVGSTARIENSLLSDGCQIYGTVINSVLSPGVYISPGAVVRDSVVLGDAHIGPEAQVDRCIIDEGVRIGGGAKVGDGDDMTPNRETPERLNTGLSIVGLAASVADNARIGRNVAIRPRTSVGKDVPSGSTL
jgi:glucose-1-phosphate adenylyltransferase